MNRMKHLQRIAASASALGLAALLLPTVASAQGKDGWQFEASVYGYLPSIGGKTVFPGSGSSGDIALSTEDVINGLKMVFMGSFEARYGRWGAFADYLYMDVGGSKSETRKLVIGGVELPAGATANLDLDEKGGVLTLAGIYRTMADPDSVVDVLFGARSLNVKQTLGWNLNGNIGATPIARNGSRETKLTNWDAIIGVKGRVALGAERRWFVPYYADIGAGDSDLTWQATAGIGYSYKWGDITAAWRYLDYNMKSGKAIQDLSLSGPVFAAVFRW